MDTDRQNNRLLLSSTSLISLLLAIRCSLSWWDPLFVVLFGWPPAPIVLFGALFGIEAMFCSVFCSATGVLFGSDVLFGSFVLFGVLLAEKDVLFI